MEKAITPLTLTVLKENQNINRRLRRLLKKRKVRLGLMSESSVKEKYEDMDVTESLMCKLWMKKVRQERCMKPKDTLKGRGTVSVKRNTIDWEFSMKLTR